MASLSGIIRVKVMGIEVGIGAGVGRGLDGWMDMKVMEMVKTARACW